MSNNSKSWNIKYAPKDIADLILPKADRTLLENYKRNGLNYPLIFHGEPGNGKTTTARILAGEVDHFISCKEKDADKRIADLRNFYTSNTLFLKRRVIIVDDCHYLKKSAYQALEAAIDLGSEANDFIITTNDLKGFGKAFLSRCNLMRFDHGINDELKEQIHSRLNYIFENERVEAPSRQSLSYLVVKHFPDIRKILISAQDEICKTEALAEVLDLAS